MSRVDADWAKLEKIDGLLQRLFPYEDGQRPKKAWMMVDYSVEGDGGGSGASWAMGSYYGGDSVGPDDSISNVGDSTWPPPSPAISYADQSWNPGGWDSVTWAPDAGAWPTWYQQPQQPSTPDWVWDSDQASWWSNVSQTYYMDQSQDASWETQSWDGSWAAQDASSWADSSSTVIGAESTIPEMETVYYTPGSDEGTPHPLPRMSGIGTTTPGTGFSPSRAGRREVASSRGRDRPLSSGRKGLQVRKVLPG